MHVTYKETPLSVIRVLDFGLLQLLVTGYKRAAGRMLFFVTCWGQRVRPNTSPSGQKNMSESPA